MEERGRLLPALAVAGDASLPVGPGDRGAELRLTGIASRTLDQASRTRLHLNLGWLRRLDPAEEERRDRWRVAVGVSRPAWRDTAVVASATRETQERGEGAANILEAGLRWAPTPDVMLGAALGTGIGRDSPRFRAVLSIQISLRSGG